MAASAQLAVRTESGLWVRPEPVRISWILPDLVAMDGHRIRCTVSIALRALNAPAEIQMMSESLMSGAASVTAEMARLHFEPSFRSAVATVVGRLAGEGCLAETGKAEISAAAVDAAKRVAFGCGIEVLPPCDVEVESPSLTQLRIEAMQREAAKQRMADQADRFQRAAEMLKQFEEMRASSPQLAAGRILDQLDAGDRGAMLQTLLMASAQQQRTETVWAVAGSHLVEIDLRQSRPEPRLHPLTATLGPLRSINTAPGGELLVGARNGVLVVKRSSPGEAETYADPGIVSQMGFSQAIWWGEQLWACHSEGGVVGWPRGQGVKPLVALRPVQLGGAAPRNLAVLDDSRLVFSSGPRLMVLQRDADGSLSATKVGEDASGEIVAVLPSGDSLVTVLRDGVMQVHDRTTLDVTEQRAVTGAVTAAAMMPWMDEHRLLMAEETGPVVCVGLLDGLLTQYAGSYRGLKVLAPAGDILAAMTADRQRIIWWETWSPSRPAGDVYITGLTRHRVADLAI